MIRAAALALLLAAAPGAAQDHHQHGAAPAAAGSAHAPPTDHYADRDYPPEAMARARARMMAEHGGATRAMLMLNIAEYRLGRGRDGWRWDGEGWIGGDIDRLVVKSEGEAERGRRLDEAEVQALWSRAVGPYFDLQAGVRQDVGRAKRRTWATVSVEGLAPYWFETEAALFLSDAGEVAARLEGWYDQRITQRLVLQPRVELNLAARNSRATRTGAGLSDAEVGLRLRYEFAREFAPYLGVSWEGKAGRSRRYARAAGEAASRGSVVAGVRFWF